MFAPRPDVCVREMLRVAERGIVSFPNFGHWKIRLQVGIGGHMPTTDNLPYAWWETPNIHFCSIKDFRLLCMATGAKMEKAVALKAVADESYNVAAYQDVEQASQYISPQIVGYYRP